MVDPMNEPEAIETLEMVDGVLGAAGRQLDARGRERVALIALGQLTAEEAIEQFKQDLAEEFRQRHGTGVDERPASATAEETTGSC